MIVCHCAHITSTDIKTAVRRIRSADVTAVITPGRIYKALGKSPDCGGCMPIFIETMRNMEQFAVSEQPPRLKSHAVGRADDDDCGR